MAVVILGSRPAPSFPNRIDAVVYANGAIVHSDDLRASHESLTEYHVLSNSLLTDRNELCVETRSLLVGRRVKESFVVEFRAPHEVEYSLDDLDYEAEVVHRLSRTEKEEATRRVIGNGLFRRVLASGYPLRDKASFLRHYVRTREMHLSTGLLSLILAIDIDLPPPYILAGIGLANSGYAYTDRTAMRGHQINDSNALAVIVGGPHGAVTFTTEPELAQQSGLRLWTD